MEWSEVIENPLFENLPFKIELNRFGQILMSPASNSHGNMEYRAGRALEQSCPPGEIIIECSIQTSDGVKVADVAWASTEFINKYGYSTPYLQAPEICVEILSPSNSEEEMRIKTELYLACGAQEVWLINAQGKLRFFSHSGELSSSARAGTIWL